VTALGGHADFTSPEGESVLLNEAVMLPVGPVPTFASGLPLAVRDSLLFFFLTLVTGPSRSLGLELSDTRVYEP